MNTLGERIKFLREKMNLTQTELAEMLGMKTYTTVSKWESNDNFPKGKDLKTLAETFNVSSDFLLGLEKDNVKNDDIQYIYSKLETPRQKVVYETAKKQLEEQNNKIVNLQNFKEEKQRFEFPWKGYVSAGTGEYMDGEINETICLYEDEIPDEADFALTINGDSMKPMFKDHETIFVKKTKELQSGSIGIVIVNDESYIKKIYYGQFSMTLVSLNSEYDDVHVDRNDNVKFIGKVIL